MFNNEQPGEAAVVWAIDIAEKLPGERAAGRKFTRAICGSTVMCRVGRGEKRKQIGSTTERNITRGQTIVLYSCPQPVARKKSPIPKNIKLPRSHTSNI